MENSKTKKGHVIIPWWQFWDSRLFWNQGSCYILELQKSRLSSLKDDKDFLIRAELLKHYCADESPGNLGKKLTEFGSIGLEGI